VAVWQWRSREGQRGGAGAEARSASRRVMVSAERASPVVLAATAKSILAQPRDAIAMLSVVVLSALALVAGAVFLWRRGEARKQAMLMLVLAVVMIVNALIWSLRKKQRHGPEDRAAEGGPGN
jgi:nitrogen fixation-related uncharacterized protein